MMAKNKKNIIYNYLEGSSAKEDAQEALDLISEEENKNLLEEYWMIVTQQSDKKLINKKALLGRIHHQINTQAKETGRKTTLIPLMTRIAAVLLIPLLIYTAWDFYAESRVVNQEQFAEVASQTGVITSINLPDGSKVWLNNFTTIRYPLDFSKSREVFVEGEAYFEVVHRNRDRFTVNTNDISVEVLGTKFNVSAYREDIETSVVLSEGKVRILNETGGISEVLKPNDKFSLDKAELTASVLPVNSNDYSSWRMGYLSFREEPLSEVIKKMERWYNVDIEMADKKKKKLNYRGTFKDEPLEEVLRLISLTAPLKYTINKRIENHNGEYDRKQVIIEKK